MGRLKERTSGVVAAGDGVVLSDKTGFTTTQTTSTFTMTPTRVDTGTAGSATGAITASATDETMRANVQTAIRALGGIYADAIVTTVGTDQWIIEVLGGYDVTWTSTATGYADQETAAAYGSGATRPGSVTYSGIIPVGRFARVKRVRISGFKDASLDVTLEDTANRGVFTATAIDTENAGADVPFDKLLTADGLAGEDGAVAAGVAGGVFDGPVDYVIAASAPALVGQVQLFVVSGEPSGAAFLKRTSGAKAALSGSFGLGDTVGIVRRINLKASADATIAPTIKDAYDMVVYTKTSSDYTTAVDGQLSKEGVDQANNAVADTLDVVAKSPLTLSGTGLDSGTFTVEVVVEV